MRILVFFDLPVYSKILRKDYRIFRRFLINDGYDMIQFSVYGRICNGVDAVDKHLQRLKKNLPSSGSIRSMTVTESQFARMEILVGEKKPAEKKKSDELTLFF